MPSTEIDEIFSSKSKHSQAEISSHQLKGKEKAMTAGSSEDTNMSGKKKKKKKKIKSTIDEDKDGSSKASSSGDVKRKCAEPETIIDPSAPLQTAKKTKTAGVLEATSSRKRKKDDDVDKFRDSRGTGPRRKTEEGFSIYKEDELGIGDQGGDTPLCPFDCECCF